MSIIVLILGSLCLLTACSSRVEAEELQPSDSAVKMILDLDTGIDDAMALAYALGTPEVELLGVVGSFGNVAMERGLQNTLDLLNLLGETHVPVYAGESHAIHKSQEYFPDEETLAFHGANGLGDIRIPTSKKQVEKENGVDFLIRMADTYKDDLTIVAVGPLTNLAKAMERDESFEQKVGRIVIMGGALTVPGNMNQLAEANIFHDPIAARRVLRSKAKITMVGLDVTLRTIFTKEETRKWRGLHTPSALAYADIVDFYIDAYERLNPDLKGCALHDPLAVAVAVDPSLVTTFNLNMEVGTDEENWGRTIGDKNRLLDENPNVSVCINVDHKTFNMRFLEVLSRILGRLP